MARRDPSCLASVAAAAAVAHKQVATSGCTVARSAAKSVYLVAVASCRNLLHPTGKSAAPSISPSDVITLTGRLTDLLAYADYVTKLRLKPIRVTLNPERRKRERAGRVPVCAKETQFYYSIEPIAIQSSGLHARASTLVLVLVLADHLAINLFCCSQP